jgi:hypothetical protein
LFIHGTLCTHEGAARDGRWDSFLFAVTAHVLRNRASERKRRRLATVQYSVPAHRTSHERARVSWAWPDAIIISRFSLAPHLGRSAPHTSAAPSRPRLFESVDGLSSRPKVSVCHQAGLLTFWQSALADAELSDGDARCLLPSTLPISPNRDTEQNFDICDGLSPFVTTIIRAKSCLSVICLNPLDVLCAAREGRCRE